MLCSNEYNIALLSTKKGAHSNDNRNEQAYAFDIVSMSETPKVLFVIYDKSDVAVRNWVNVVIYYSMQTYAGEVPPTCSHFSLFYQKSKPIPFLR